MIYKNYIKFFSIFHHKNWLAKNHHCSVTHVPLWPYLSIVQIKSKPEILKREDCQSLPHETHGKPSMLLVY